MPILPPELISTWYIMYDTSTGNPTYRLLENWSESQSQSVTPKPLLQGDIGTHVMDIGGIKYTTTINSPVVIVETNGGTDITSVFDLLLTSFNVIFDPTLQSDPNLTYILKSAAINIRQEGVTVDLTYWSSQPGAFQPAYISPFDFIARTARFYDTTFVVNDSDVTGNYQIITGSINIDVNLSENYFINTGSQLPYFGIQGYTVKGNVDILATPITNTSNNIFDRFFVTAQSPGILNTINANTSLKIGNVQLNLGQTSVVNNSSIKMSPNQPTTVKLEFNSYVRYTSV